MVTNTTTRAVFVRDAEGNLCTILPGQPMPPEPAAAEAAQHAEGGKAEAGDGNKPARAGKQPAGKQPAASGSPIHDAARKGEDMAVAALLDDDPELAHAIDALQRTALHIAAWAGHANVIAVLAAGGASVHAEAMDGMRAVHFAAANGHEECIKQLLKNGSKVNVRDNKRLSTPLHAAASKGHVGCAAYLLKKNADPSALDKSGKSPAHLAATAEIREMIEAMGQKKGMSGGPAPGADAQRGTKRQADDGASRPGAQGKAPR